MSGITNCSEIATFVFSSNEDEYEVRIRRASRRNRVYADLYLKGGKAYIWSRPAPLADLYCIARALFNDYMAFVELV